MKEKQSYTVLDFYLRYIEDIEKNTSYDIDFSTYRAIVFDYFKYIRDQIFDGKEFKLPYRLGSIQIIKHKPKEYTGKSLRYDWQAMKQLGKKVYYLNEWTNGYKYRYFWSKKDCIFPNKTRYMFIASRANKRDLAKVLKAGLHDYPERLR